ncbi:hypothetical protein ILUMI_21232 [Ignelater luminosus]|uniref:Peptidase S1 domain-containing protein n=1 Tax=Ignelater luminosus TaxID=2038154 RepID=A0A8K0FY58_IGNLU|nr:hypothetical protein ILUMI_21232 [Ignelater luminosus]
MVLNTTKVHGKFNTLTIQHDIGLIILNKSIRYSDFVHPIELETCYECSGWGETSYSGLGSNNLPYVNLKISNVKYQMAYEKTTIITQIFETQLCKLTREGEGACKDDPGGPLIADGKQVGIVSLSELCDIRYPDVYAKIFSYIDWIARNFKD